MFLVRIHHPKVTPQEVRAWEEVKWKLKAGAFGMTLTISTTTRFGRMAVSAAAEAYEDAAKQTECDNDDYETLAQKYERKAAALRSQGKSVPPKSEPSQEKP